MRPSRRHSLFSIFFYLSLGLAQARAQSPVPGSLDTTFGYNGVNTTFGTYAPLKTKDMAVGSDGRIFLLGDSAADGYMQATIVTLKPNGQSDNSYGIYGYRTTRGNSTTFSEGNKIAVQNSRAIVAMVSGGQRLLVRLGADGYEDYSFGYSGFATVSGVNTPAAAMEVQPDGKILVLGTDVVSGRTRLRLDRFTAAGSIDLTFGTGAAAFVSDPAFSVYPRAMTLLPDGKILVGGYYNTQPVTLVAARFLSSGALDPSFGVNGMVKSPALPLLFASNPDAMTIDANGQIIAAGSASDGRLVIVAGAGSYFDSAFGSGGVTATSAPSFLPNVIVRRTDGRLFAGLSGSFGMLTCQRYGVFDSRFGSDGVINPGIGIDTAVVSAMKLTADGKILAFGSAKTSTSPDVYRFIVARFNTDGAPSAPSITQPPVAQIVPLGTVASFTVGVDQDNTSVPAFQWRHDGKIIPGATSSTLTIASAQLTDEGGYTVEVSNLLGTVSSTYVLLKLIAPPVIVTPPQDFSSQRGPSHAFSITVSGHGPFTYQWQKNEVDCAEPHVSWGTSDTLNLQIDPANAGSYRVIVTNPDGSATSQAATFASLPNPPVVQTTPANSQVLSSDTASSILSVTVTGWPPFTFQWQKDGVNYGPAVQQSDFTNQLYVPANTSESGHYRCVVTNIDGSDTSAAATVRVTANPPKIQSHPQPQSLLASSASTAFNVTVTGRPPFTFQWQKDSASYGTAVQQYGGSHTLTVPLMESEKGLYRCVVTNVDGTATSDSASLEIWPSGTVHLNASRLLLSAGTPLPLHADVFSAFPVLRYEWQFNRKKIADALTSDYNIAGASYANAGSYRMLAGTLGGTYASDAASVAVVESADRTVAIAAGKTVVLTAKTAGDGLSYVWHRQDGQPLIAPHCTGAASASLKITAATQDNDGAMYYCEVTRTGVATPVRTGLITLAVEGSKPELDPIHFTDASVALAYAPYQLTAAHTPTRFNVSGLPTGLKCDALTGIVSGTPSVYGTFKVKVSATNPVGTCAVTTVLFNVNRLDRTLVGTSTGPVFSSTGEALATVVLSVGESGAFTGKSALTFNSGHLLSTSFSGQLLQRDDGSLGGDSKPFNVPAYDRGSGLVHCLLSITWNEGAGITAHLHTSDNYGPGDYDMALTRNAWNARTNPASAFVGYHTVEIQSGADANSDAAGSGYASFTVTTGGTFTLAGRLPDGTAFAIPAYLDSTGNGWFHTWLYSYKGQIVGSLLVTPGASGSTLDNFVSGGLHWHRPASTLVTVDTVDNGYFYGFDMNVTLQGARYLPPNFGLLTGPYMMNAQPPPSNIQVSVQGGLTGGPNITTASLSTRHSAVFPAYEPGSPLRFTSLTFNPSTGIFTGTATYYLIGPSTGALLGTYPTTFQGIVTRADPSSPGGYGVGYFARSYTYAIYSPDPDIFRPLQQFPVLISGSVRISPQ